MSTLICWQNPRWTFKKTLFSQQKTPEPQFEGKYKKIGQNLPIYFKKRPKMQERSPDILIKTVHFLSNKTKQCTIFSFLPFKWHFLTIFIYVFAPVYSFSAIFAVKTYFFVLEKKPKVAMKKPQNPKWTKKPQKRVKNPRSGIADD